MLLSHPLMSVRFRRDLLGIKATEIARRLGMEPASYSRIERGERRCYIDKAIVLAKMLHTTVDQLEVMPDEAERIRLWTLREDNTGSATAWTDNDQAQLNDLTVPSARGTVVTHTPVETQSTYTPPNLDDPAVMAALVADWSDMDDDDTVD